MSKENYHNGDSDLERQRVCFDPVGGTDGIDHTCVTPPLQNGDLTDDAISVKDDDIMRVLHGADSAAGHTASFSVYDWVMNPFGSTTALQRCSSESAASAPVCPSPLPAEDTAPHRRWC